MEQRRGIFFALLAASVFTLLLGFAYGLLLRISLGVDVALAGFVVYLVRTKARRVTRDAVTYQDPATRWQSVPSVTVTRSPTARRRDPDREWLRAGEL